MGGTSTQVIVKFLEAMIQPLLRGCNDQGALIYESQITIPKTTTVVTKPLSIAAVAHALEEFNPSHPDAHPRTHLGPLELKQDSLGRILNSGGKPYAIVHQADRFSKVWETRFQPIQLLSPNPHPFIFKHDQ